MSSVAAATEGEEEGVVRVLLVFSAAAVSEPARVGSGNGGTLGLVFLDGGFADAAVGELADAAERSAAAAVAAERSAVARCSCVRAKIASSSTKEDG